MIEIKNKIIKTELVEWRKVNWFQSDKFKDCKPGNLAKLKASLVKSSFAMPFMVWQRDNKSLLFLDGHHRHKAMMDLDKNGLNGEPVLIPEMLPANFVECANEAEAAELLLTYSSVYANITEEGVADLIKLHNLDFAVINEKTNLPEINLSNIYEQLNKSLIAEEQLDEVPELQKEAISKLGDIFLLNGKHRVMCGDSTVKEDVQMLMDGKKADMVFTDPPYGMNLEVEQWNQEKKNGKYYGHNKNYKKVQGDATEDFNPLFIKNIFDLFGYCKEMFLWGADYYSELLINKNQGCWFVWDKRDKLENVEWKTSEFELCWSKRKHQRKIARIRWLGLHGTESEDTRRRVHPTQKPTKLLVWFFGKFSFQQKEKIIDLFLGSGSTLIACEQTNRICYGMELDPYYVDVILRRYHKLYPEDEITCLTRSYNFEGLWQADK